MKKVVPIMRDGKRLGKITLPENLLKEMAAVGAKTMQAFDLGFAILADKDPEIIEFSINYKPYPKKRKVDIKGKGKAGSESEVWRLIRDAKNNQKGYKINWK